MMSNRKLSSVTDGTKHPNPAGFFQGKVLVLCILFLVSGSYARLLAQPCQEKIGNNKIESKPAVCVNTVGLLQGSTPVGGNNSYRYQWEINRNNCGENSFLPITGATGKDYNIPESDEENACYRRVVISGDCRSESNKIKMERNDRTSPVAPVTKVIQPLCGTPTGIITVTKPAPAPGISYSIDGITYNNTTGIFAGLSPKVYQVTTKYPSGCISPVNLDTIKVVPLINGTIRPEKASLCWGNTVKLTLSGGTSYQWYRNGTAIEGATGESYTATQSGTYTADILLAGCKGKATNEAVITVSEELKFGVSTTNPNCTVSHGSITVKDVLGGSGSGFQYSNDNGATFQPSNTFSKLAAGTYQVVVKDNAGCKSSATEVKIIAAVSTLSASTTVTNSTCSAKGGVTIQASGGVAPYQYGLNGGGYQAANQFSGLAEGEYTVRVKDAAGCVQERRFSITQIASTLSASTTVTNSTCSAKGGVTIQASGGVAPYQYGLNGGGYQAANQFSGLAEGEYTVRVKDAAGCVQERRFSITQIASTLSASTTVTNSTCSAKGGVTIQASGGVAPYQYGLNGGGYQAANQFSGLAEGEYTVRVKDAAGCVQERRFSITQIASTLSASTTVTNSTCSAKGGVTIQASGGVAPYQYGLNGGGYQAANQFSGLAEGEYTVRVKDAAGCVQERRFSITQIASTLSASTTVTNSTCSAKGGVTIQASGGVAPYQYGLNGGGYQAANQFSGLAEGEYTVRVKDAAGCVQERRFSITQIASTLSASTTVTNSTCSAKGGVTIQASGGVAPYQYGLNGGGYQAANQFSGLAEGEYTVRVKDAAGCVQERRFSITQIASTLSASTTVTNSTCSAKGGVTIQASGGVAPYQYGLNGGGYQAANQFSGLAEGEYTVRVKDAAGCVQERRFSITQIASTLSASTTVTNSTCSAKGGVTIQASGGVAPYQYGLNGGGYQAANQFSGLAEGEYTVRVKDAAGCVQERRFSITQIASTLSASTTVTNSTCSAKGGVTIQASGGVAPYQYGLNGGGYQAANQFSGLAEGEYTVRVKDAAGCVQERRFSITQIASTLSASTTVTNSTCSAKGGVTIQASGGVAPYQYGLNGGGYQAANQFSGLAEGEYTVRVKDAAGCVQERRFSITQIASTLSASTTVTNSTCSAKGGVTIQASGGVAPYQYGLNGGGYQAANQFSGLAEGEYTVRVKDAAGCVQERRFSITQIASTLSASTTVTNSTCSAKGGVTIQASGGVAPYQYGLNGGGYQAANQFSGLAEGEYTVRVKDAAGCVQERRFSITQIASTLSASTTVTNSTCSAKGGVTIQASGGVAPYQYGLNGGGYQAANQFSGLAEGEYTVRVKDAAGCVQERRFSITQIASTLSASTTVTNSTCSAKGGVTIQASGGVAPYQYGLNGGGYQAANQFSGLAEGEYTVRVKDAAGCVQERRFSITQIASTLSASTTVTNSTCSAKGGVTIQASGGVAPYQYGLNGGGYQAANQFSGLAEGEYTVRVKDAAGCVQERRFSITQIASTLSASTTVTNSTCSAKGGVTIQASGGVAPYQYGLNGGGYQAANQFSGLAEGEYTVRVKDAAGCVQERRFSITQIASTLSASTTVTNSTCSAKGGVTIQASGGVAPYQYGLNGGGYQAANQFSGLAEGEYTVRVKDAAGCVQERRFSITQIASTLSASTTVTNSTCSAKGGVTIQASGGVAPYQYGLNGGGYQAANQFSGLAEGEYTVRVKDAAGCVQERRFSITQIASTLSASTTVTNSTCSAKGGVTIQASGGVAPYQYGLNGGGYQAANQFSGLAEGEYTVRVKDAAGCVQERRFSITQIASTLSASTTVTNSTCSAKGGVTIQASGGVAPYQYGLNGGGYQAANQFSGLAEGEYTVRVKDAAGCVQERRFSITQIASTLSASTTVTNSTCSAKGGVTIQASGGVAPYQYGLNGGGYQAANQFSGLAEGEYTVRVKDAAGCVQERRFSITQIASTLSASTTVTNSTCSAKGGVTIQASGGVAPYQYGLNGGGYQAANQFSGLAEGEYTVRVKDAAGCVQERRFSITQIGNSPVLVITDPPKLCAGSTQNLEDSTLVKGSDKGLRFTYWTDSNATSAVPNPAAVPAGQYYIKGTDANGCFVIKPVVVSEQASTPVSVTASGPTTLCAGRLLTLTASAGTTYQWYRNGEALPGETMVSYRPTASGSYTVVVSNGVCTMPESNATRVLFHPCYTNPETNVSVPTAFTPNKNGANDVLRPLLYNIRSLQYFRVLNRWGQLVFQTNVMTKGWDGTINGLPQPAESYTWLLECTDNDGKVIKKSGRSLLIR